MIEIFPDPAGMPPNQLAWSFVTYGYVLFFAAQLLSDGSELLLLVPQLAGVVGSIVLPVLGAVPDGMMVLFSGLGPIEEAQESVAVGVGALAGSTIMLLTVPWFLSVLGGRVDIKNGETQYATEHKLTKTGLCETIFQTGIKYQPQIRANAKIMIFTAMTYLVIQIPSFLADDQKTGDGLKEIERESGKEKVWALLGMFICIGEFIAYLYLQYAATLPEESGNSGSTMDLAKERIRSWFTAVSRAFFDCGFKPVTHRAYQPTNIAQRAVQLGIQGYMAEIKRQYALQRGSKAKPEARGLLAGDELKVDPMFRNMLRYFFAEYTKLEAFGRDKELKMSKKGFERFLGELHIAWPQESVDAVYNEVDEDKSGSIDFEEFVTCFKRLAIEDETINKQAAKRSYITVPQTPSKEKDEGDEDEDENESVPEEWKDLSPAEQQKRILMRSFYQMGLGTLLVLIFSDPMVDVLNQIGIVSGIPAFYISFVLAPLASNASELVAAYNYAQKKTPKTITISLNTLEGAACMNNTFCLAIFLGLIYVQGLAWKFTAETLSILVVELVMFLIVLSTDTQRVSVACLVLLLMPGALALVYYLENYVGLD